jgi:hypothetical protein
MGRHRKQYANELDAIKRLLYRGDRQELRGQTKLKHYHQTEFVECAICGIKDVKLHRHRIIPNGGYTDENTIIVCVKHHKLIHKIIKELDAKYERDFRMAIALVKMDSRR